MKILFSLTLISILFFGCKSGKNPITNAHYKKYVTGADGTHGMLFFFKVNNGVALGDLQSVYVNNLFVQNSTKATGDTLMVEASILYVKPNRGFDPETGLPEETNTTMPEPLFTANRYSAVLTFLKNGKLDSLKVENLKPLEVSDQTEIE